MIEVVEASKRISIENDDSDEGINLNELSDNDDLTFKVPGELTAIKKHSQRKSQRRKTAKKPQPTKVEEKPDEFVSTRNLFGLKAWRVLHYGCQADGKHWKIFKP